MALKKIVKEFQDFISRGSVVDLAVGVIVGGAFSFIKVASKHAPSPNGSAESAMKARSPAPHQAKRKRPHAPDP